MAKLTQAQIKAKADEWGRLNGRIAKLEADRNAELHPLQAAYEKKTRPIIESYDERLDPLQEKSDAIEMEVLEWLRSQKKSVRLEGKLAIAEFLKSEGFGNRVVDAEKFVELCRARNIKDFWRFVTVTIKDANQVMGKEDMEDLCDKPKVTVENASLRMKD